MKINCKPGDTAHVIVPGPWLGALVSVLHAAPAADFRLPDGYMHDGCRPGLWVIESLGRDFDAPTSNGGRKTRFGVCADSCLRPIRDSDEPDEMLYFAGKPQEVVA